jgi:hypothetical protein
MRAYPHSNCGRIWSYAARHGGLGDLTDAKVRRISWWGHNNAEAKGMETAMTLKQVLLE